MEAQNRVALVTGAAHGIGAAVVRRLAGEGAAVFAVDLDPGVRDLGDTEGGPVTPVVADITDDEGVGRLVARIRAEAGRFDILVNNAARQTEGSITDLPLAEWDAVHAVCLRAPFLLMKLAIPSMIRHGGGVIVNMASIHGLVAYRRHPAYDSAKAGLLALTRQAALDYGPQGVRAVAISPGLVVEEDPLSHPRAAMFPVGRTGSPGDIAELVAYLTSPRAAFINGANLVIDGGLTAISPQVYWTPPMPSDPAPDEGSGTPGLHGKE